MFPWGSFLAYVLISAFTPGPNNIIALSNGTRLGLRGGLPYNLGLLSAQLVLINLGIFICRAINELLPLIAPVMRLVGAAYMLYLAWKIFRSSGETREGESHGGYWQGIILQFVNPKFYLYVMVSAEAYILPVYQSQPLVLLLFGSGMALICFASVMCWLCFGSVFRRVFNRHGKLLNIIMALLLVYCAVSLFL